MRGSSRSQARVTTSMLPSRTSSRGRATVDEPVIDVDALARNVVSAVCEIEEAG